MYSLLKKDWYTILKSKGKTVHVHAIKAYRESRGIAPPIFKLGIRLRWVVSFARQPLHPHRKRAG
jgi:hypothetical protein